MLAFMQYFNLVFVFQLCLAQFCLCLLSVSGIVNKWNSWYYVLDRRSIIRVEACSQCFLCPWGVLQVYYRLMHSFITYCKDKLWFKKTWLLTLALQHLIPICHKIRWQSEQRFIDHTQPVSPAAGQSPFLFLQAMDHNYNRPMQVDL